LPLGDANTHDGGNSNRVGVTGYSGSGATEVAPVRAAIEYNISKVCANAAQQKRRERVFGL